MRVPAVLSFDVSGDLLCTVNLAQEVFFRNVVGVVDEMITADRHGVGLEPTFQNQPARQGVDEVSDQPCRRNAIDPGARPRDPRPVQIFLPDTLRLPLRL
jgi:hypothetical protein